MKDIISKELLSEAIGYKIIELTSIDSDNDIEYTLEDSTSAYINIYELAHKCKQWANITKGFYLSSGYDEMDKKWEAMMMKHTFIADSEPEAIFKACQWILDNKGVSNGRA